MGDPWKGYKVFFRDNLFEEDMIVFRTNSYHSLFRQLKKVLNTRYGSLMGHKWPNGIEWWHNKYIEEA